MHWLKRRALLWTGIALMAAGVLTQTFMPWFSGDMETMLYGRPVARMLAGIVLIALLNAAIPLGAAIIAASLVIRRLAPRESARDTVTPIHSSTGRS